MNTRDQAEPGDGDPTKTVQLDDAYKLGIVCAVERDDSERSAHPVPRPVSISTGTVLSDDQLLTAGLDLDAALAEFKMAAAAVIDRIKAGEHLPKPQLDSEWNARRRLIAARQLVERLRHRRNVFTRHKQPD